MTQSARFCPASTSTYLRPWALVGPQCDEFCCVKNTTTPAFVLPITCRKRVQRSQKAKELRATHFSKVAADRVRAPVSQQVRAGSSSTSRQVCIRSPVHSKCIISFTKLDLTAGVALRTLFSRTRAKNHEGLDSRKRLGRERPPPFRVTFEHLDLV